MGARESAAATFSPTSCAEPFRTVLFHSLVVPGSHKLLKAPYEGWDALPPAINLEAKAGTCMLFEGRLLHGTGVNRTPKPRTILVMNSTPPFYRQQETFLMSADTEWLTEASPKLLYRMGATAGVPGQGPLNWIEGCNGHLVAQRIAMERGELLP